MATSATRKKRDDISRPFDPRILRRARAIAASYRIALWREHGEWYGQGVEETAAMGNGRTIQQAVKSTREALISYVAYLLETGRSVAAPLVDQKRHRKAG